MRQFLLSIAAILVLTVMMSASPRHFEVKPVDFDSIKSGISDPRSKYYYPVMMEKYLSNDTLLGYDAYRYLYYGYSFQDDFDPFRNSEYSDVINELYYKKEFTRAECDTIIKYAELTLRDNIFDLSQMKFYIFALREKEKNTLASIRQYKLNHIVAAILSSGSGTKEKPWVVISPAHEYNLLNLMGYVATGHTELENNIDYITIEKSGKDSPEGFYFDATRIKQVAKEKYPEQ